MQIPKKPVREKLAVEEGAAAARLSKKLVQLQTDIDLPPLRCGLIVTVSEIVGRCHVSVHLLIISVQACTAPYA